MYYHCLGNLPIWVNRYYTYITALAYVYLSTMENGERYLAEDKSPMELEMFINELRYKAVQHLLAGKDKEYHWYLQWISEIINQRG